MTTRVGGSHRIAIVVEALLVPRSEPGIFRSVCFREDPFPRFVGISDEIFRKRFPSRTVGVRFRHRAPSGRKTRIVIPGEDIHPTSLFSLPFERTRPIIPVLFYAAVNTGLVSAGSIDERDPPRKKSEGSSPPEAEAELTTARPCRRRCCCIRRWPRPWPPPASRRVCRPRPDRPPPQRSGRFGRSRPRRRARIAWSG